MLHYFSQPNPSLGVTEESKRSAALEKVSTEQNGEMKVKDSVWHPKNISYSV